MRIRSAHSRDLEAPPAVVGHLLARLGSDRDPLWPSERWPDIPVRFDRPLAVGARGGHGLIRYWVEGYEPGHSLQFRFEAGQGIDGFHRFDVEDLGAGRSRLVHTLEVDVSGTTRLVSPVLRRMHDALIEDLLDRAEVATSGSSPGTVPLPTWMRVLNAVEARVVHRSGEPAAVAGGMEHAKAGEGGGHGARGSTPALVRSGTWTIAGALLARGAGSLANDAVRGVGTTYRRYDAAIYSPLSLVLGSGAARVARRRSLSR